MNKFKKFYDFQNKIDSLEIWVYGEIISGSDKWSENDVTYLDFKEKLDNIGDTKIINMYINSPGGSVIATQGIIAMLQRIKEKGVTINAWIDGLGASCASFLPLVAHNVYTYKSSLMMVHHPMTFAWGNVNDLQAQINVLNKIEDSVMMPLYMSKVKEGISENYIKDLIDKESWLDAKEMSRIFNITILDEVKDIAANLSDNDLNILSKYKNIPDSLKNISHAPTISPNSDLKAQKLKIELQLL